MGDSVPFESRSSSPCIKDASSLMLSAPSLSSLRPFDWSAAGRGLTLRRRCSSRSSASVGSSSRGGAAGRWKSVSVTDVINLEGDGVSDTARSSGLTAASSATAGSCSRNWTSESPRRWLRAPRVSIASAIAGVDGTCRSVSVSDMVSAGRAGRGGVVWTGADRSPKAGAAGGMCSSVAVSDEERTGARPRSEKLFGDSALADGRGGGGGGVLRLAAARGGLRPAARAAPGAPRPAGRAPLRRAEEGPAAREDRGHAQGRGPRVQARGAPRHRALPRPARVPRLPAGGGHRDLRGRGRRGHGHHGRGHHRRERGRRHRADAARHGQVPAERAGAGGLDAGPAAARGQARRDVVPGAHEEVLRGPRDRRRDQGQVHLRERRGVVRPRPRRRHRRPRRDGHDDARRGPRGGVGHHAHGDRAHREPALAP
mmetsp:Transcript_4390/g.12470  ORF Transcript_4390/g.12470 Transcript_4390/m.12470 type:complete len:427 (+) Transcript_4390:213-1493(+)